jgi:hypothetical protein
VRCKVAKPPGKTSRSNLIHRIVAALALVPLLSVVSCAAYQKSVEAKERLFSEAPQRGTIDEAMRSKIIRHRFVTVNVQSITGVRKSNQYTGSLELNLFDDAIFKAVLDRREVRSETSVVWLGHIEGVENSQVTLAAEGGIIAGNIRIRESLYQVRYIGEGTHVIYQIDPTAFPPDSGPLVAPFDRQ